VWWQVGVGVVAGLLLIRFVLIRVLWQLARYGQNRRMAWGDTFRLLPGCDSVGAAIGAVDRSLPSGVRVRMWLLLGHLALPIDVVPDFIPVIGFADEAIIVVAGLRSVIRRAGRSRSSSTGPVRRTGFRRSGSWPGSAVPKAERKREAAIKAATRSRRSSFGRFE
jgi:uncharacterized membrane protein YkvA (DUF1232 family)